MPLLLWPLSMMTAMVCVVPPSSNTSSSVFVSVAVVLGISVLLLLRTTVAIATVAAMDTGPSSSTRELNWS